MVSNKTYIPHRGDIVWLDFDPQAGREQAGRRPALVLSDRAYNERSELMVLCPVTSQYKPYPFVVALPETLLSKPSYVLSDQVKSLDWTKRNVKFMATAPAHSVAEVTVFARGIVEGKK
jgi:mRNA interferase MazF